MEDEKDTAADERSPIADTGNDFIFRFTLPLSEQKPLYADPLTEMLRSQICNLLKVVTVTSGGREVPIDGFTLFNDPETVYPLFPKKDNE